MPASSTHLATPAGPSSIATPSSSSTSAEPACDDAARLPCFTTRAPAPAAINAAIVDTLTVPDRSPPVPQVSIAPSGTSMCVANRCIARTSAASSDSVSPLVRSATMKAAACTSETRPSKISPTAASTASGESSTPRVNSARIGVRISFIAGARSIPPTVVVENTPRDQPELDLRRAFDNRQLPCITVVELGQVILHIPGRAEHLERFAGDLDRDFTRLVLRHRKEGHVLLRELALVGHGGGAVREEPGRLDLGGELGDLPLDALHVGDRLAERGALLHVLDRVHERAFREADAARRDDRPHRIEAEHRKAEAADLADDVALGN